MSLAFMHRQTFVRGTEELLALAPLSLGKKGNIGTSPCLKVQHADVFLIAWY
jgi:hypothetical protein